MGTPPGAAYHWPLLDLGTADISLTTINTDLTISLINKSGFLEKQIDTNTKHEQ